jgi:predicted LPLAT superfamily acyltransferase
MTAWVKASEKGSIWGMRFTVWAHRRNPRAAAALARLIAFYFWLFDPRGRRASRDYFTRLTGRDPGFWHSLRHYAEFAQTTVDRLSLWSEGLGGCEVSRHGEEHLFKLMDQGRGAILLGAHLGSFDAMRAVSAHRKVKINVLTHRGNSRKISSVMQAVFPESDVNLVEHDPASPEALFELKQCVDRGEFVALLGDRAGAGDVAARERRSRVPFLGAPADFPQGPLILASLLECPVLLTFGLRTGRRRYALHAEPFADKVVLPRAEREAALSRYLSAYAARLEDYCRRAPMQWFNFFDFWRSV